VAAARPAIRTVRRLDYTSGQEKAMVRIEYRIVFAAIAVFLSLAGMATAIHGLLVDDYSVTRYGAAAIVLGVACFVLLLNPTAGGRDV
jgi:hypothetical protein